MGTGYPAGRTRMLALNQGSILWRCTGTTAVTLCVEALIRRCNGDGSLMTLVIEPVIRRSSSDRSLTMTHCNGLRRLLVTGYRVALMAFGM